MSYHTKRLESLFGTSQVFSFIGKIGIRRSVAGSRPITGNLFFAK